jgi:cephalosporin hydroxylase
MKPKIDDLWIDFSKGEVRVRDGETVTSAAVGSPESFEAISRAWLRSGWDAKYVYAFSWLGRPIIQLPEDLIRLQEIIFTVQPNVILETGVAHGGGLIFYASLCKAIGKGRVIGIDIDIRPHNRRALEQHFLSSYITLIEGSSIEPVVLAQVKQHIKPSDSVLVLLDSAHDKAHVLAELHAYAPVVSVGSYLVAMDGIMAEVVGAPRTKPEWAWDNPKEAALTFVAANADFEIVEPPFLFNEGTIRSRVTYWPGAFVKRVR